MTVPSERGLEPTREKLRLLEDRYTSDRRDPGVDDHVWELSKRSLKRLINQLKEEIAREESRNATPPHK